MLDIMDKIMDFVQDNGIYVGILAFIVIIVLSNIAIDMYFNKK